ncbi:AbfB domain-containing protein [Nitrosomonas sp.]|uniref:AbfB domain-containing protein n=1 Tax=Nitrosomonas sp. TaxID=42353 RepID=UPI0025CE7E7E|nr:AbfB domain-containing protein [Nitrosomonas sp.]MBV6446712.1 hypothetical protein [Nitrosomonas sp.]
MSNISNMIGNLLGRQFSFRANNYPDLCLRHRDGRVFLDSVNNNDDLSKEDSAFTVVPGLSGTGISFKSKNYPDHFIRHRNGECFISPYDGSDILRKDASWVPHEGLAGIQGYTFEAIQCPGLYMRHKDFRVRIDRKEGTVFNQFNQDATWLPALLVDRSLRGEWRAIYKIENVDAEFKYSKKRVVGIQLTNSKSVSKTEESAWKASTEVGAEGYGMSCKAMFEVSGMKSVTEASSSSWQSSQESETTEEFIVKRGDAFYLWQWCLIATFADGFQIETQTDIYSGLKNPAPLD